MSKDLAGRYFASRAYQPGEIDKDAFITRVIEVTDNTRIIAALDRGSWSSGNFSKGGMMSFAAIASWTSIIIGFVAAVLWFRATRVEVRNDESDLSGWQDPKVLEVNEKTGMLIDVLETAKAQTYWNRWAARATGVAAIFQAIAMALSQISH